ncbi:JHD1 [[Candida] subhashii]|uniref:[histone H3]-dimethyl-L-lysine(36) demethylase n=1 Tax=[Candida] subhashii TaxID=561895 RepID=A0A8J5QJC6_9ASCO|nr:JHD1 [[Candida] subhashii]KAG7663193.1 JHD1 [[Candida] subhashii]
MKKMPSIDTCPICINNPLDDESRTSSTNISWLQCEPCKQWFHTQCLQLTPLEINNLHSYHCKDCIPKHGDSIYKRKSKRAKVSIDYVALNEGDTFAVDKSCHPHLPKFLEFSNPESKLNPHLNYVDELTKEYALSTEMKKPILIRKANLSKVGMELPIPRNKIDIQYITSKVGDDHPVEVMDVLSQQSVSPGWKMGQWRDYFLTDENSRDRIRNVISLEISQAKGLGDSFKRPTMVEELDLVDKVWNPNDEQSRSKVTKYCLMSVKNSFTDFHIDFGGTSVYYTVCKGLKTFMMYPPTQDNLDLYTSWCLEQTQNFIWFGEYSITKNKKRISPKDGFKVTLEEGDLFIIPSGWIHAVHTPQDSLVIGGNYLTLRDMKMQLKINDIERKTRVPSRFRFPMFNKVIWLTGWYYLNHKDEFIEDIHSKEIKSENTNDEYELLDSLVNHLEWHLELSKTNTSAKRSIPIDLVGKPPVDFINKLAEWRDTFTKTTQ